MMWKRPRESARKLDFEFVGLDDLLARRTSSRCTPRFPRENYHLLNRETFAKCKRGVLIINTARGALIETRRCAKRSTAGRSAAPGSMCSRTNASLRDTASNIIAKDIVEHLRSDALPRKRSTPSASANSRS
jgi:D-lactate dehydrogenase